MSGILNSKIAFILWSTLSGTISFFIGGVIVCMISSRADIPILNTIIAGSIGGFLLGLFLRKRQKIGKMTISGIVAVPVGFWSAFILAAGVDFLFSIIGVNSENPNISDISNIIGIILMGTICGAIFGAILYGCRSVRIFAVTGATASFPFGVLVGALNSGHWIKGWLESLLAVFGKIDLNLLAIIMSFGIGIGLSIGLYEILKRKNETIV